MKDLADVAQSVLHADVFIDLRKTAVRVVHSVIMKEVGGGFQQF